MNAQRRDFLRYLAMTGTAFGAGYGLATWQQPTVAGAKEPKGEEWRNDKTLNTDDLSKLRPDSEVLQEAQAQIAQHRKGTFALQLIQPDGAVLSEKNVKISQIDQLMDWGCSAAGSAYRLQRSKAEQQRAANFAQLFNCTTAKCYWDERWHQPIEHFEGLRVYDKFLDEIGWANELGLKTKGHPLVWTVPKAIPNWLLRYPYSKQLQLLEAHVRSLVAVGGQQVALWDLCNEMLWEPAFKNIAKRKWPHLDPLEEIADYIALALNWARGVNPKAIYSLNDYGLLYTYRPEISAQQQRERYLKLVQRLRQKGTLPNAIGCQTHVGGKFRLDAFKNTLNDLKKAQLPIQITEFWAQEKDFPQDLTPEAREEQMAAYVCQMYTVAYSEPLVNHITYWGSSLFFKPDGSPRLAFGQLQKLIHQTWRTEWEGQTDAHGLISFNGYFGHYEITFESGHKKTVALSKSNGSEPLRLYL